MIKTCYFENRSQKSIILKLDNRLSSISLKIEIFINSEQKISPTYRSVLIRD